MHSRNAVDPNDDPNAYRSGKHRTVFARCFLSYEGLFYPIPVCADMNPPMFLAVLSRIMRKKVCRLRLNEVSQQ